MFLLGFTWVFAFFAVSRATKVFDYLFSIFNTLQGMFIFTFYCLYKKDTRDIIKESVNKRKRANPRRVVAGRRFGNEIEDRTAETNF
ncbi:adhesion G-protein coupled receptor G2-like [Octopus sinensis]|nr:adhesion G-protein coupled receptor G2-like [Octopus sinensis]